MIFASPIVMPKLGLTMTEGTVASWQVAPGDDVNVGDVLFVVETEKAANEILAETAGRIGEILVAEGRTAPVGAALATWSACPQHRPAPAARVIATPLARKNAVEIGLDLKTIAGTGPNSRIKAIDVATARAAALKPTSPAPVVEQDAPESPAPIAEKRRSVRTVEETAARRLSESKRDTPHFYVLAESDVTALLEFRSKLNRDATALRLTLTHFVIAAVARALAEAPDGNSVWNEGEIVGFDTIDVGVAVDTPRGLVAPVLRDVGRLGLDALANKATLLVQSAREGRLRPDDMAGGAITVSNVGMFGASRIVPIISPGQSAILGVGAVRPAFRPDRAGAPKLCQELGLALSADHRVWDGVTAARFLDLIVQRLEQPLLLLR